MCGEKLDKSAISARQLGSPPRVRGKEIHLGEIDLQDRITPACAGKREPPPAFRACGRDHPRVCGEKAYGNNYHLPDQGSPPRVRGKVFRSAGAAFRAGITPACAGKRRLSSACTWLDWDHPRVCGEKIVVIAVCHSFMGSPPRVRGKAGLVQIVGGLRGITPACAGKRPTAEHAQGYPEDHPRVCGEKTKKIS